MTTQKRALSNAADAALTRLRDGNSRFVSDVRKTGDRIGQAAWLSRIAGQKPFAVILSCADSRVPSELVFDAGIGDLFVIRVAGNIVAPSLVGSVEFAAAMFGTRLAVVMGHSQCGAIKATIDVVSRGTATPSDNIQDIVDRCRAPVETVLSAAGNAPADRLLAEAVRANVRHSCSHLRHASRLLEKLCAEDGMRIVGAEYSLETGKVDFFDGV